MPLMGGGASGGGGSGPAVPISLVNGGFGLSNTQTAVATTGNIAALNPVTTFLNMTAGGGAVIQGMISNGTNQRIVIRSTGAGGVVVKNQDASATAANRFELEAGKDLAIVPGAETEFMYNTSTSRWNVKEIRNQVANNINGNLFSLISGIVINANNIVLGNEAVGNNTYGGGGSVILGFRAAKFATGAVTNDNVIIGSLAASAGALTGATNVIIGNGAGLNLASGASNVMVGLSSGTNTTTGIQNTFLGQTSGSENTTGRFNIAIGLSSGVNHQTGDYNIAIGQASGSASATNLSNTIAIGTQARATASDQMILGGTTNPVNVGINNNSPAYRLDVGGDINTSGNYYVGGVLQSPWLINGNAGTNPSSNFIGTTDFEDFVTKTNNVEVLRNTADGLTGFQKTAPASIVHVGSLTGSVTAPGAANNVIALVASGYTFGSGDKNYEIYSTKIINGSTVFSSTSASTAFTEPASSGFDPTSFSAPTSNASSNGYDPTIDPLPSYQLWAQYVGDTVYSLGTVTASVSSWSDPVIFQEVDLSWAAPIDTSNAVSSYFIVRNGTDYIHVSAGLISYQDTNVGWSAASVPFGAPMEYEVSLSFSSSVDATGYRALNTTLGTFLDGSTSPIIDDASWASGSTVTPTSAPYVGLTVDGNTSLNNLDVSGNYTSTNGNLTLTNGNLTLSSGNLIVFGTTQLFNTVAFGGDATANSNFTVVGITTLGSVVVTDNKSFTFGTTNGTRFGTGPTEKLGFFGATAVVKPTGDIPTALGNLGLVGSGTISATSIAGGTANSFTSKKFLGGTATPTWVVGVGAGTGGSVFSAGGSDVAGAISISVGTTPTGTNAIIATATFNVAYTLAPYVVLTPADANTALLSGVSGVYATSTTTTFVIKSGTTALTASTTYKWFYVVMQ